MVTKQKVINPLFSRTSVHSNNTISATAYSSLLEVTTTVTTRVLRYTEVANSNVSIFNLFSNCNCSCLNVAAVIAKIVVIETRITNPNRSVKWDVNTIGHDLVNSFHHCSGLSVGTLSAGWFIINGAYSHTN